MPFDNPISVRPYMREGTAALAALVATRPARDVLASIAAEVALFVPLIGKPKMGARVLLMPAPRFWPGGSLPDGYRDMGEHVPRLPMKAAPGSQAWMTAVRFQRGVDQPGDNGGIGNRLFHAEAKAAAKKSRKVAA
jgi:hypothetical protein